VTVAAQAPEPEVVTAAAQEPEPEVVTAAAQGEEVEKPVFAMFGLFGLLEGAECSVALREVRGQEMTVVTRIAGWSQRIIEETRQTF
jgi:hypothetical protein